MSRTNIESYERMGIDALVRAGEDGYWFTGHFGAALIAGARLLRNPALPGDACMALDRMLEDTVAQHARWFEPLHLERDPSAKLDPVLETLRGGAGRLRSSGHPTIYLSAGLWALARHPDLATRRTVDGLCALFASVESDDRRRYYGVDDYFPVVDAHAPDAGDEDVEAAIDRAFGALEHLAPDREIDGHRYFVLGDKFHLLTHAHAAHTFAALGHADIAGETARAHALHARLLEPSRALDEPEGGETRLTPWDGAFWERRSIDTLHQIKLAEAIVALWPNLSPDAQRRAEPRLRRLWFWLGIQDAEAPAR